MKHPVYVYASHANPAVSAPLYRISRAEAAVRLEHGYVIPISDDSVQLKPSHASQPDQRNQMISGLFKHAWQARWSSYWLVWQMPSNRATKITANE